MVGKKWFVLGELTWTVAWKWWFWGSRANILDCYFWVEDSIIWCYFCFCLPGVSCSFIRYEDRALDSALLQVGSCRNLASSISVGTVNKKRFQRFQKVASFVLEISSCNLNLYIHLPACIRNPTCNLDKPFPFAEKLSLCVPNWAILRTRGTANIAVFKRNYFVVLWFWISHSVRVSTVHENGRWHTVQHPTVSFAPHAGCKP